MNIVISRYEVEMTDFLFGCRRIGDECAMPVPSGDDAVTGQQIQSSLNGAEAYRKYAYEFRIRWHAVARIPVAALNCSQDLLVELGVFRRRRRRSVQLRRQLGRNFVEYPHRPILV